MREVKRQWPLIVCYSGYEKCESRHSYGPAVRTQYLIHYVLSGKGCFRTEEQEYRLEANSVFLIRPDQRTYYEADGLEPWEYCWVGFDGTDAKAVLEACGLLDCPVKERLSPSAQNSVLRLYGQYTGNQGNAMLYTGLLYQFFSCFCERSVQPGVASQYVEKATEYMHRNYMYAITVAQVAAYVGIDRSYLYRLFRQLHDVSPQQYLHRCRMEAAQRMLLESTYNVTEIAYSCGFQDSSALDKAFHRAMGQSPSSFRRGK